MRDLAMRPELIEVLHEPMNWDRNGEQSEGEEPYFDLPDPAVHLEMAFEPGDIQLLANAEILHCREAYEDDAEPARRRHLLRLWRAAQDFASVDEVLRGGIPAKKGG